MEFKFVSLQHPDKLAYTFHSDSYWQSRDYSSAHYALWSHAGMFDTYGDGLTQHSSEVRVPKEQMGDYFASLAAFLLEGDHLLEYGKDVALYWPDPISRKTIDFLHTVKFDGKKKRQYYTTSDSLKVTTDRNKQFDKRYFEVKEHMDGSVNSVHRLVHDEYWDFLTTYLAYREIREHASEQGWDNWCQQAYEFFSGDYLKLTSAVDHAVGAMNALVKSFRLREMGSRLLRNWLRVTENETAYQALYPKKVTEEEAA